MNLILFSKFLFLCGIQRCYTKSHKSIDGSREVNKLIGKILHSSRFNELADVIADRAIVKLNELQQPNFTANNDDKDVVFGSPKLRAVGARALRNHKHINIDTEAVLKHKVLPVDDLRLRYKRLKQINSNIDRSNVKETHKEDKHEEATNDKPFLINREKSNKKHNSGPSQSSLSVENKDFQKLAAEIKADFDENIKTRSDEAFDNPFGDGQRISWRKQQTSNSPLETDPTLLNQSEKELEKEEKPQMQLRTEGNKTYTYEQSPDYKEYHEEMAKLKIHV